MTVIWSMVPEIWSATDKIVILDKFLAIYCLNTWKIKILKKWKKHLKILSFYISVTKIITIYCSWYMVRDWCNCYFSFWAIFCPFTAQKKIFKKMKKLLEMSPFYTSVPKIMIRWCTVPEKWYATDGQTDGWMDRRSDT